MILDIFIATVILWLFFIAVATVKNKFFDKNHPFVLKVPMYLFGLIFLISDVAYNYTYGSIAFWEFADNKRKTLTARLKHILHSGLYDREEWRFRLALFMCKRMIEPWDYEHCALSKLES